MLLISPVNVFNSKNIQQLQYAKTKKYHTNPNFSSVDNKNLYGDTVSFKGLVNTQQVRMMVEGAGERLEPRFNFSAKEIDSIISKVNPKNIGLLPEILNLYNKKLSGAAVINLLNYINKETTDIFEFKDKLDALQNLKRIVSGRGFKQSILADYLDEISMRGILDLLMTDILLEEPKHDFNSLQYVYNYAAKYFEDQIKKYKHPSPDYEAAKMMKEGTFSNILTLGMVYDKSVLNELFYNRGKYLKSVYMPRFRQLNEDDLNMLRKVQISAVTDKENKGGDYATYEVSADDKIWTMNFLSTNREIIDAGHEGLDFNKYIRPVNIYNPDANFVIKFQDMKKDLTGVVLKHIGVDSATVDKYMQDYEAAYAKDQSLQNNRKDFWDINYSNLLNAPKGSLLRSIILADTYGNFHKMLFEKGAIAEKNKLNEIEFTKKGLDYQKWLKPTIKPITNEFVDNTGRKTKLFTVKNWDRSAKESLFDGNYTTCCTGIDKDQGESFPHYMTNRCTRTLEVRIEKNKVIAMSRILMAKVNGVLSMVVENIEVNNKMVKHYLYDDATKYKFREMIFDYARKFAKNINNTDKEIPVYFCGKYYKVKDIEKGLGHPKKYEDIELIGQFPDDLYVNAYGSRLNNNTIRDDGDEVALTLIDISKKSKPVIDDGNNLESDSNYNYADVMNFNHPIA